MNQISTIIADAELAMYASPFEGLAYRSLVFARCNGSIPLYFVAGLQGGPWGAENALPKAHKVHGGRCFYCSQQVPKGDATIDHVEPVALGGNSAIQNLVIACKPCNAKKGHKVLDFHNPKAGKAWLKALHVQIEQRLSALTSPSLPK